MPLPKPEASEDHDQFIDRCMASDTMRREFPDPTQRYAVCQAQWEKPVKTVNSYE